MLTNKLASRQAGRPGTKEQRKESDTRNREGHMDLNSPFDQLHHGRVSQRQHGCWVNQERSLPTTSEDIALQVAIGCRLVKHTSCGLCQRRDGRRREEACHTAHSAPRARGCKRGQEGGLAASQTHLVPVPSTAPRSPELASSNPLAILPPRHAQCLPSPHGRRIARSPRGTPSSPPLDIERSRAPAATPGLPSGLFLVNCRSRRRSG